MKLAIIGSRNFNDYSLLKEEVSNIQNVSVIISGGAKGADQLAEQLGKELNIPLEIYHPDWAQFGRAAGPIRNTDIIKNSDMVLAFWDGKSRGTFDGIKKAKKFNKQLKVIKTDEKF